MTSASASGPAGTIEPRVFSMWVAGVTQQLEITESGRASIDVVNLCSGFTARLASSAITPNDFLAHGCGKFSIQCCIAATKRKCDANSYSLLHIYIIRAKRIPPHTSRISDQHSNFSTPFIAIEALAREAERCKAVRTMVIAE